MTKFYAALEMQKQIRTIPSLQGIHSLKCMENEAVLIIKTKDNIP